MSAAFRHLLLHPSPHHLFLRPATLPCPASISAVRLQQTMSWSSKAKPDDQEREGSMAQNEKPTPKTTSTVDPMSNSFGEGYATRSEEEGFGGVYGGNQRLRPEECDKENVVREKNHSDDYRTQGSEVKEKEKGRNLPHGHHVG